jgi:hypothetical protein
MAATGVGDIVLEAHQSIDAALAANDTPIPVRQANGELAGVLTRQRVFDALAST